MNEFHHRRHKADFEDARKHRVGQRVRRLFRKLAEHDPLFTGTIQIMDHHIRKLPASLRRAVEETFTRCPAEALDFYREMRAIAAEVSGRYHARRNGGRIN